MDRRTVDFGAFFVLIGSVGSNTFGFALVLDAVGVYLWKQMWQRHAISVRAADVHRDGIRRAVRSRWWWTVLLDQVANRLIGAAVLSLEFDVLQNTTKKKSE